MRGDFIEVYDKVLGKWGVESQNMLCIEEMSELIKELCKIKRYKGTDKEVEILSNIKEEIADVLNMIEQLERYYGEEEIECIRKNKIERFLAKYNFDE